MRTAAAAAAYVDTDDKISTANQASIGQTITGYAIDDGADVDMFAFTVAAGKTVIFDIDLVSGNLDSYIRLFKSTGTSVTSNDDGPAPAQATSNDSYLSYTFTTAGTYYLGVSAYSNTSYSTATGASDKTASTAGAYTLKLIDGTDPDDQISEAHAATIGQTITDTINPWTDVDMYYLHRAGGQDGDLRHRSVWRQQSEFVYPLVQRLGHGVDI